uniref:NHL repeat containing protein n=1 Tax=Eiseniibacteriota bacterium TaxID=2212470 RepID=A0A832I0S1_UNCEI
MTARARTAPAARRRARAAGAADGPGHARRAAAALLAALLVLGVAVRSGAALPDGSAAREAAAARGAEAPSDSAAADVAAHGAAARAPLALRDAGALVARGDGRGAVIEPSGLAVDAFGRVHVVDAALHRVQQFDAGGAWRWEAGGLGSDAGQMRRPTAAAPLGALGLAVLDAGNRRIASFDLFGRRAGVLVDLAALEADDPLGRIDPVAMAADRGGAVVVADAERDRVLAFDFSGRPVATIGGPGARPGSFRGLRGVAVTARGELVTAERGAARVQRLDAGGRVVASWPIAVRPGSGALALACDDSGRVALADEEAGTLRVFDAGGGVLAALDGLAGPRAVAFARDGALLVAEARAGRVRRFVLEPAPHGGR